jgi:hypothetical protein
VSNDISTQHTEALYWVPGHAGVQGNKIANRLAKEGFAQKSVRPQPSLGVSIKNIKKIKGWVDKQHLAMWRGHRSTQRRVQKLILGPSQTTKTRLLTFNRAQSRVIGLLTRHNNLR